MKILILLSLIFTLTASAGSPCPKGMDACWKWGDFSATRVFRAVTNPFKAAKDDEGLYYARGIAATCEEASHAARLRMMERFDYLACEGETRCGTNGAPFLMNGECETAADGKKIAWLKCDNVMSKDHISPPQNNTGAGIILIESARRGEIKARASRSR